MAPFTRESVGRAAVTAAIFGLFLYVSFPFLIPVTVGAVGAVLVMPAHRWLIERKWRSELAAAALMVGLGIGLVLPAAAVSVAGVRAGLKQLRALHAIHQQADTAGYVSLTDRMLDFPAVRRLLNYLQEWFDLQPDEVVANLQELLTTAGMRAADGLGDFLASTPRAAVGTAIALLSLFFFLVDGRKLAAFVRSHSFFEAEQTERLIRSFGSMCRSVVMATLVSGAAQTLLFTVFAAIAGTPNLALASMGVFIFSFVPLVGTLPATLSVVAYHAFSGSTGWAVFLAILAFGVTLLDNVIRPLILKGAGNLHPLLAFVAAFGAVQTMGAAGVFLGPILAGLFVVTLKIFLEREPGSRAY
ncbi:MAG: AI-2E family transporter [Bdellovibrionales bacterium]|nr:AI-2E family transporter [Bdellovibrionales bacterium]